LFIFIVDLPVRAVQRLEQTCVTGSAKTLEICLVFLADLLLWLLVVVVAIVVV